MIKLLIMLRYVRCHDDTQAFQCLFWKSLLDFVGSGLFFVCERTGLGSYILIFHYSEGNTRPATTVAGNCVKTGYNLRTTANCRAAMIKRLILGIHKTAF